MRILHVFDHSLPLHSGYTFRSASILREQRALGWETLHLTGGKQNSGALLEEQVDGWRFYRTPDASGWMARVPVLNQFALMRQLQRRLLSLARELKPDVIHAHSPALNGVPAVKVGRRLGIPVVYETRAFWEDAAVDHGTTQEGSLRYRLTRALETWVFRRADAVTTICEGLRSDIVARGIPAERVTIIPNAVDAERFSISTQRDAALETELGLAGKTVLGFLGSFYGYEGLHLLIEALPGLLQRDPDIRVLLVGGGFQEERLRAMVDALGVAEQVIFTGRVPHGVVDRYYSLVDVLVYPRLSMRLTETVTPLKPLEAMAQGKLLIASDVGGHRELIRDGETGMLFRAGDSRALADCVWRMLDARERWDEIRINGRRFVDEERNWRNSIARYPKVYADAQARAAKR